MTKIARSLGLVLVAMTLSVSRGASAPMQADKKTDPPTVDGRWTGRITGTPHGDMAMGLSLKQDGTKVTGTLTTDHTGDLPVEGELQGPDVEAVHHRKRRTAIDAHRDAEGRGDRSGARSRARWAT